MCCTFRADSSLLYTDRFLLFKHSSQRYKRHAFIYWCVFGLSDILDVINYNQFNSHEISEAEYYSSVSLITEKIQQERLSCPVPVQI